MSSNSWTLTILAIVAFLFGVWPGFGTVLTTKWVVGICLVLIILISWTSSERRMSQPMPKSAPRRPVRKRVVRRRRR